MVIGGVNIKEQINTLQNVGVDIVVGTPGRLEDLIQGGGFCMNFFHLTYKTIFFRLFIII